MTTILGIDIGGTGIKGAPVDLQQGTLAADRLRIPTPPGGSPGDVARVVGQIVDHFDTAGPIGCTFPAVVQRGVALTAANVDPSWVGTDAQALFEDVAQRPCIVVNDADAAGIAEVEHGAGKGRSGTIMMITLGTGIGSALFVNGQLVPNTEFGHLDIRGKAAELRASETGSRGQRPQLGKVGEAPQRGARPHRGAPVPRPDHHRRWRQQEEREVPPAARDPGRDRPRAAPERGRDRRRRARRTRRYAVMTTAVDGPTAVTTSGSVRGKVRDRVNVFRGIPFAAPPVGASSDSGRRRSRSRGTGCSTRPTPARWPRSCLSALEKMLGAPPPRWDEAQCLTLNVTTPALDGAKRPVMFWIHGGAFVNGAGSSPVYDGTKFAQHGDVVVVTVNYRLGAFGFLHLDEVFGADFAGSGNAGILDQVAALEWVRDNIEAFGGDPDHVTIFGESAGGMSVGTLLGLPRAEGLYHRAIVQSGSSSFALPSGRATTTAREVLALAGVTTVEELESVPAEQILTAQAELLKRGADVDLPFQPVIDGAVVPELPLQTIASGATGNVATMVGTTADEMTLFLALELGAGSIDAAALRRQMERLFGDGAAAVIDTVPRRIGPTALPVTSSPRSPPTASSASPRSASLRPRPVRPARRSCTCSRGRHR